MGLFSWVEDLWDSAVDIVQDVFSFVGDVFEEVISWFTPETPDLESQYGGTLVNKQSNIAPIPVIYGIRKVGGVRVFVETSSGGTHEHLYIALVLCEGGIDSIQEIYIDDELAVAANGVVTTNFSGNLWINKYTGTDTQVADALLKEAPSWNNDHKLKGVAYLACKLKWNKDIYSSLPSITAIVKGRKVYQPLKDTTVGGSGSHRANTPSTWEWIHNPADCLLDYMRNDRFGKGLPISAFESNFDSWRAAATKCNALETTVGSAQISRFWCNANLNTDAKVLDNVKVLLSGMRGLLPFSDGVYKLIVEDKQTTVEYAANKSYDLDTIIGGISINGMSKKDRFNKVTATFPNPDANWQLDTVDYPEEGSTLHTDWIDEDRGFKLEKRISLNTITNYYQAQDIAELFARKSRESLRCTIKVSSEGIETQVGDVINVTHPTPGWIDKPFRVMNVTLNVDGTVGFSLIEHQNTVYGWSTPTAPPTYPDTELPDPSNVGAPTSVILSENLTLPTAAINVSWTSSTDAFVIRYLVQYKATSSSTYISAGYVDGNSIVIRDLIATTYNVRVKAENTIGATSAWAVSTTDPITVTAQPTMPNVTNLAVQDANTSVVNEFTGKDAKFVWDDFDTTGQDPLLFADYVVKIKKVDNTLVRTEAVHDNEYIYTYEKNVEDNTGSPLRQFRIEVTQRGNRGQVSPSPATIGNAQTGANKYPNNPAPSTPSATVNSTFNTLYMNFNAPDDTDFAGYKVWASKATPVTITDNDLVYKGIDNLVIINEVDSGLHNGTKAAIEGGDVMYYKYAAYDAFGETNLNVSTQATITAGIAPTGGIQTYYEPLANVTCDATRSGAILFDTTVTTGNNKPYRCNGTTWEIVNDLAISDSQIVANTITAGSIAAGTITGNEIDVNNISAHHVNVGSSATSGARMNISATTIKIYDATNTLPRIVIGDLS